MFLETPNLGVSTNSKFKIQKQKLIQKQQQVSNSSDHEKT